MRHNDGNNDGEVGTPNLVSKKIGECFVLVPLHYNIINFDKRRGEYCAFNAICITKLTGNISFYERERVKIVFDVRRGN